MPKMYLGVSQDLAVRKFIFFANSVLIKIKLKKLFIAPPPASLLPPPPPSLHHPHTILTPPSSPWWYVVIVGCPDHCDVCSNGDSCVRCAENYLRDDGQCNCTYIIVCSSNEWIVMCRPLLLKHYTIMRQFTLSKMLRFSEKKTSTCYHILLHCYVCTVTNFFFYCFQYMWHIY